MNAGAGISKGAIVGWGRCQCLLLPCGWRKEGQGEFETGMERSGRRPGTSPVELHHGASFLRPANPAISHLRLLSLSPLVRVFRCFLDGFIFEDVMRDCGKGWGASITKLGCWDWVEIGRLFLCFYSWVGG